jgi:hypothetical protein
VEKRIGDKKHQLQDLDQEHKINLILLLKEKHLILKTNKKDYKFERIVNSHFKILNPKQEGKENNYLLNKGKNQKQSKISNKRLKLI